MDGPIEHNNIHESHMCKSAHMKSIEGFNKFNRLYKHCIECDFKSTKSQDVTRHRKKVHGVPYEFICDIYGHDCIVSSHLVQHKKIHYNMYMQERIALRKKYQCSDCDFVAREERGLKKHVSHMHKNLPHKYEKCPFSSKYLKGINHHMSFHERVEKNKDIQFSCNHCPKSFKSEVGLNMHNINFHKLERVTTKPDTTEYKCPDCDFFVIGRPGKLMKHALGTHRKVLKIKYARKKISLAKYCTVSADKLNLCSHVNGVRCSNVISATSLHTTSHI